MEKFVGFAFITTIATCGLWLLYFLIGFLPYWMWGQGSESKKNPANKGVIADKLQKPLNTIYKK